MTKWELVSCKYLDVNKAEWVDLFGYMPEKYTIYLSNDQDFVTTFEENSRAVHFTGENECRAGGFFAQPFHRLAGSVILVFRGYRHSVSNGFAKRQAYRQYTANRRFAKYEKTFPPARGREGGRRVSGRPIPGMPVTFEISGHVNPNPEARIEVRGSENRNLSALQYMLCSPD